MSAHTPGPWQWVERGGGSGWELVGPNGEQVADDGSAWGEYGPSIRVPSANAALIAAAPEKAAERDKLREVNALMLEALEKVANAEAFTVRRYADDECDEYFLRAQRKAQDLARAAIAAAKEAAR